MTNETPEEFDAADSAFVRTTDATIWHPILRTCREEIEEALGQRELAALVNDAKGLIEKVQQADEAVIEHIATKLGDKLMQGGDYWEGLVLAAELTLS